MNKKIIRWSIFLFLAFVLFSFVVSTDLLNGLDFKFTVLLQNYFPNSFIDFFSGFSEAGSFEVVTILLLILLDFTRKSKAFFVLLFFAGLHIIELIGKSSLNHLPPPHFLLKTRDLVEFPQFYVRLQNSFPSGHTARAVFVSVIVWFLTKRSKKLSQTQKYLIYTLIIAVDVVMFISRPYLGEHWATDVAGGILLGLAFGILSLLVII